MFAQHTLDMRNLSSCEAVIFTQIHRPRAAVEIEDCFAAPPDYVNMSGTVIVWVNDHSESVESENCGQGSV